MTKLDSGDFLVLASQCGFALKEVDLTQLSRRNLIVPWTDKGGGKWYSELHLFVVAKYLEAVRPVRHPWGTRAAEISLDEVGELGEKVNGFVEAQDRGERLDEEEAADFLLALERYLAQVDPFGPLSELFDFVQPGLRSRLRNEGRLFVELRKAARGMAERVEGITESVDPETNPMTQPMFGVDEETADDLRSTQVIGDETPEDLTPKQKVVEQAIDEVLSSVSEVQEEPYDGDGEDEDDEVDGRTQVVAIPFGPGEESFGLGEESSEPIVLEEELSEDEIPDDFSPASEPREVKTGQTEGLNRRLDELRKRDATKRTRKPPPLDDRKEVARRIAHLNRQRESYLREGEWQKLVDLYEEGIELFSNAEERRQVFQVLGKLYESKLDDPVKACGAYARALTTMKERDPGLVEQLKGLCGAVEADDVEAHLEDLGEGAVSAETKALVVEFSRASSTS